MKRITWAVLLSLALAPLASTGADAEWWNEDRFVTVPLDSVANSEALLLSEGKPVGVAPGALPAPGRPALVHGIPFLFVDGQAAGRPDHVDVGESLFDRRNAKGGYAAAAKNWAGAASKTPGRIQIADVPSRRYRALHVIAGADGEDVSISMFTAAFYRPSAGFPKCYEVLVPLCTDQQAEALPLEVELTDGSKANLWLISIPLDPAALRSFSDMKTLEIELAKGMQLMRSHGDPYYYSTHPAGLPSGVHVYALTLEQAEVDFDIKPTRDAHVFTAPEKPGYEVTLENLTDQKRKVRVTLESRSYDGKETARKRDTVSLKPHEKKTLAFQFKPKLFGLHDMTATVEFDDVTWVEPLSFAHLRPDQRPFEWDGTGPLFGYWGYGAGHYAAPSNEVEIAVMHAAGARGRIGASKENQQWRMRVLSSAWHVQIPPFMWQEGYSQEEFDKHVDGIMEKYREEEAREPYNRPGMALFFPEPHIALETPPPYYGEPDVPLPPEKKERARVHRVLAEAVAKRLRAEFPDMKLYLPWGDPMFAIYMLREGYDPDLMDGSGIDSPNFERLPEQQLRQISTHRLYLLNEELKRLGATDKEHLYCEGIFVPTEPGACTWREQMDIHLRWYLISLAYGVDRFYSGAFAFDCGDYYGAEHYGGCGIFNRVPYYNPKPTYTAYATMTEVLRGSEFDGWVPTGSPSAYCLRFNRADGRGPVHALWTLRGTRPMRLLTGGDAVVIDSQHNEHRVKADRQGFVEVTVDTTPVWLTGVDAVERIELGAPDHSDSAPAEHHLLLDNMSAGWTYDAARDKSYEENHWDTVRFPTKLEVTGGYASSQFATPTLRVHMPTPEKDPKLMPLYGTIVPAEPITIPGKASALGIWVNGDSSWGRVVYKLRDAKGELWTSIGTPDEWNADDIHSWSFFNFDGWRYLRFPLPSHAPYDSFREQETTWWLSEGGDEVVDLPLTLEKIFVEMRTHVLYVNGPVKLSQPRTVELAGLTAEYAKPADMTAAAVALHGIRMPGAGAQALVNPIAELSKTGVGAPTAIERIRPPDWGYDGTRAHVYFKPVAGVARYQVWFSPYADGRGARIIGTPKASGELVQGLRPDMKLYLYVTYTHADGKRSKPSAPFAIELKDEFGMK